VVQEKLAMSVKIKVYSDCVCRFCYLVEFSLQGRAFRF
jgi:predicted DsbA family dithiol-disulfide isomerase